MAYKSQAARDAEASGYGGPSYWEYLDRSAQEHYDYYISQGDSSQAQLMLTRTLGKSLQGNDGV